MAEKTVAQLQKEYAKITEENRKAYDEFVGVWGGIHYKSNYEDAISKLAKAKTPAEKEKYQAIIDKLKPKYDQLSAAYKATQERKNALKAELESAKQAETESKTSAAKEKSAKSAYDKAKVDFAKAEANIAGYGGEDAYKTAYQTLQTARDEYVKAGGSAPELPEPKVTISAPKGTGATGEGGTNEQGPAITTYSDALNFLTNPANKESLIQAQKFLTKFGYKGNTKGDPDLSFAAVLQNAAKEYANLPEAWRPTSLLDYLANPLTAAGAPSAPSGPQVTAYPDITNKQDGKITINKYFQDNFGRDATPEEFKAAYEKITKEQANKPRKQTVTTNAKGEKVISYTGGTNTEQILNELVAKTPTLKQEAATYEASDAKVLQRQKDKKLYDAELAKLGNDPAAIAKLNASTSYGRSIQSMQNKIARIALDAGSKIADADLAAFAKEAIDTAIDTDAESLTAFINSKLKFGKNAQGRYTGVAGENFDTLAKVANANGIDLEKAFGAQLPEWLSSINKGESIDTYKQIIRDVAKIGMPEKVAKLIDQGIDLSTIYSPYKNLMASTLEINPQTIDMNDSTLRSAITADKEIPLYEFERQLRKDNRWQYTKQAHQEYADMTQKILQDFGFMG